MVSSLPRMVSWLPSLHHCAAILFDENKSCGNRFLSSRSMLNPVSRFGGLKVRVDGFMAAARQIQSKARLESEPAPIQDFAEFERQSQHLQSLGIRLAGAHSESMETFLLDSNTALSHLRFLLLMSLALLLATAGGLMAVLYRDLVAPLRIKLVENQMLMERQ